MKRESQAEQVLRGEIELLRQNIQNRESTVEALNNEISAMQEVLRRLEVRRDELKQARQRVSDLRAPGTAGRGK